MDGRWFRSRPRVEERLRCEIRGSMVEAVERGNPGSEGNHVCLALEAAFGSWKVWGTGLSVRSGIFRYSHSNWRWAENGLAGPALSGVGARTWNRLAGEGCWGLCGELFRKGFAWVWPGKEGGGFGRCRNTWSHLVGEPYGSSGPEGETTGLVVEGAAPSGVVFFRDREPTGAADTTGWGRPASTGSDPLRW